MSDIPPMPEGWWPENIMVTGKSSDIELAFAFSNKDGAYVGEAMGPCLDGLREAIWLSMHDPVHRKYAMGL